MTYYLKNKEYLKLKSILYYYLNRDKILQKYKSDQYSTKKRSGTKKYQHEYYLRTKEKKLLKCKLRYQMKKLNKMNSIEYSIEKIIKKKNQEEKYKLVKHIKKIKRNMPKFKFETFDLECKVFFD